MIKKKPKKQALWLAAAAEAGKPLPRTLSEIHDAMKPKVSIADLNRAATEARQRVSAMSREQRQELFDKGMAIINKGAKPHPWRHSGGGLWPKQATSAGVVSTVKITSDQFAKARARQQRWQAQAQKRQQERLALVKDVTRKHMPSRILTKAVALLPKRKPVRRVSAKKAQSDRLYNAMVRRWLEQPENQTCRVMRTLREPWAPATQCHHKRGRLVSLKFDTRFWIPVSAAGHAWIDANRAKAVVIGLLGGPGEWHVAPDDAETNKIREWMKNKGIL